MASYETLAITDDGPVRIITINRPEVLNALSTEVVAELSAALEAIAGEPSVGALLLTGAGKAFVAGADIAAMAQMQPEQALVFAGQGHALGEMLSKLPRPTLAAVNGFALGGGCELALACDFIYASEKAKFGQPEVNLGVIPGFGGTQRLLRRVGQARALELCMTGEIIRADEALRIGLVNKVVPPEALLETSIATLKTIASKGPLAIAALKEVMHAGASLPLADACDLEENAFAALFSTADQKEGMAAFLAKRPAVFQGK
ncbi:MAG: enoyl-CoA hydratase/isomerase family protein [Nannocystaceae bacterium]|nr:enoyl-CoA hydratase/isomerase family protein [Nannocystaceae bacterium]